MLKHQQHFCLRRFTIHKKQTTLKFDIRNYVDHNFDLNDDDDEELTGMLHELGSTWIFGNGTGMLPNIPQGDLFEEFPRR